VSKVIQILPLLMHTNIYCLHSGWLVSYFVFVPFTDDLLISVNKKVDDI